jgi:hypothetical protein
LSPPPCYPNTTTNVRLRKCKVILTTRIKKILKLLFFREVFCDILYRQAKYVLLGGTRFTSQDLQSIQLFFLFFLNWVFFIFPQQLEQKGKTVQIKAFFKPGFGPFVSLIWKPKYYLFAKSFKNWSKLPCGRFFRP